MIEYLYILLAALIIGFIVFVLICWTEKDRAELKRREAEEQEAAERKRRVAEQVEKIFAYRADEDMKVYDPSREHITADAVERLPEQIAVLEKLKGGAK